MLLIFIIIIIYLFICFVFFAKADNICFSFCFIKTMKIFVLCSCLLSVLFEPCTSDIYFHFPPGSNNRLNGNGVNRRNARRLFDSQVITKSSLYWSLESVRLIAQVVVDYLFQLVFIFPLFLGMVKYANEFKTKEKQKLTATYIQPIIENHPYEICSHLSENGSQKAEVFCSREARKSH